MGLSAAVTVTEDIVFAPSLDGNLYAFSQKMVILLSYDTVRDFEAVNELEASEARLIWWCTLMAVSYSSVRVMAKWANYLEMLYSYDVQLGAP